MMYKVKNGTFGMNRCSFMYHPVCSSDVNSSEALLHNIVRAPQALRKHTTEIHDSGVSMTE